MTTEAIADVQTLIPKYKSSTEEMFAAHGSTWLCDHFQSSVVLMLYEPCRWKIPGGHYTSDFMAVLEDGRVLFIEVKGSKRQKGYRDARSKLRAAAVTYPMFTWLEVVEELGWTIEVL